jgi:hypothetical protein
VLYVHSCLCKMNFLNIHTFMINKKRKKKSNMHKIKLKRIFLHAVSRCRCRSSQYQKGMRKVEFYFVMKCKFDNFNYYYKGIMKENKHTHASL